MKRLRIFIVLLAVLFAVNVSACTKFASNSSYNLVYTATEGGWISGPSNQTVIKGGDGQEVKAIAHTGYVFKCWSDGCETEIRQDVNVSKNETFIAKFVVLPDNTLSYRATEGGKISGETIQSIRKGSWGKQVNAIADIGYRFVGWDDGVTTYWRVDKSVNSFTVTAIFEKIKFSVNYSANVGGQIIGESSQKVKYGDDSKTVKAVPMTGYKFIGWSDGVQAVERSDCSIKRDIEVRANFAANDAIKFPILMVFVSELHAELKLKDGSVFKADYVMSQEEKNIYDLIQNKVAGYLNDIFAGKVVFEIDTYYTKMPIGRENLNQGVDAWLNYDYSIDIDTIEEIKDKIDDYRSILTTFCMTDYDAVAHGGGGGADRKVAYINSDSLWGSLYRQNLEPEFLMDSGDPSVNSWWESILLTYIHEFTHSAELYYIYSGVIPLDLHGVIAYYAKQNDDVIDFEPFKLYLLGQAFVEGKLIGIPSSFWITEPNK